MGSIKPLPEAVWSSVRSGIVLYDLTRVVEELVYNSLDAGATKVYVAVSAGTSLVKVVDNGYGINRDGLVLLGKDMCHVGEAFLRLYELQSLPNCHTSTSKFQQLIDLETCGSFGFRGEALCSIADVSLLEVITKTHGMPHGYRKVLKGRKCLYIGIEDDIRDIGTTVVVRDLFYNQPVRRRQMQSSPKKVLHSVKKCVLRIALVHSRVSFKVADIESDDELLSTSPCPSPLQLLSSNFGIEANNSMNELEAFEGGMKLFGYISGPSGVLSLKALQYIYINSRFVCKGPIHKMLNQLAAGYEDGKFDKLSRNEKRSRLQSYPTFVLNLSCPRSLYDITFEPAKNLVEFRDWDPVLTFVKNAVMHIWAESVSDDLLVNCEVGRKRRRTEKWQASVDDCNILPYRRKSQPSRQKPNGDAPELVNHRTESLHICDTGNAVASGSISSFCSGPAKNSKNHPHMQSYDEIMSVDNSNKQVDYILGSRWQNESFEDDESVRKMSMSRALSNDCYNITNNTDVNQDFEKQYQFSSLRRGSLLHDAPSFSSELRDQFASDDFTIWKKWMDNDDDIAIEEGNGFDLGQHDVKPCWCFSKCTKFHKIRSNSCLSSQEIKSSLIFEEFSSQHFPSFLNDIKNCGSDPHPSTTGWISPESGSLFNPRTPNFDNFIGEYDHGKRGNRYTHFPEEEDCNFTEERAVNGWPQENCLGSSCSEFSWDEELGTSSWSENGQISRRKSNISFLPNCSKTVAGEQDYGHLHLPFEERLIDSSDPLNHPALSAQSNREKCGAIWIRNEEAASPFKMRSGRSQSAPPFHRHRKKILSFSDSLKMATAMRNNFSLPETSILNHPEHCTENSKSDHALFNPSCFPSMSSYVDDSLPTAELDTKRTPESLEIQNAELRRPGEFVDDSVEDFALREVEDISEPGWKWRSHYPETECGGRTDDIEDHDPILNISSGILHLAGDSLVPSYIDKSSLKDARVLQQVDKKFIPVIAGRTLALIDQHAADERIRLEELRQKVLSGEMKQSTHLEAEQELVLPEFGYQLLHNYSQQIQHWGWICNLSTQSSRPFTKSLNALHRQPTVAKLVAVPCILGVNLTDVDLLEFLQQLADTDGSSTVPPSVHRVLNNKACRGAIMFGDTLLPSECSLIVEELKQTSLCFQCAHGRPTTVPIVNLDALHKQIIKLGLCSSSKQESWHGLQRHEVSLSRAAHRLRSAME